MSDTDIQREGVWFDKCCGWVRGPFLPFCAVYFITQWGDWLWVFASGIYYFHMDNGILRLAGVLGFVSGAVVLLGGGLVGRWVDKHRRLFVIRVTLVTSNVWMVLSALTAFVSLLLVSSHPHLWRGWLGSALMLFLLVCAVCRNLTQMAYRISLDRDWLVVVAGTDRGRLANLNAVARAVDMAAKILSPLCMGALMKVLTLPASALFICGWNIVSLLFEYALLLRVYRLVPELAIKAAHTTKVDEKDCDKSTEEGNEAETKLTDTIKEDYPATESPSESVLPREERVMADQRGCCCVIRRVTRPLLAVRAGWRVYGRQKVVSAGVGFSMLYMTVLSFDSVTTGYIYSNGVSKSTAGMLMSLAGAMGFISPLFYPAVRRCLGLEYTGVLAFSAEVACLLLAVTSIWAPGSPFDLNFSPESAPNCSQAAINETEWALNYSSMSAVQCPELNTKPNTSIILFLIGVIASRTGLWLADLSVTQIMQENIAESERGVVNGVQNSLNMLLEMVKYVLVIAAPHVHTFGILIIITFVFILTGDLCFIYYVYTVKWKGNKEKDVGEDRSASES